MESSPHIPRTDLFLGAFYPAILNGVRDSTRLFDALERATKARAPWPNYHSLSVRAFDYLRASSRLAALVRSVGLDVATFTSPSGGRVP